jgi:hypothetical protein
MTGSQCANHPTMMSRSSGTAGPRAPHCGEDWVQSRVALDIHFRHRSVATSSTSTVLLRRTFARRACMRAYLLIGEPGPGPKPRLSPLVGVGRHEGVAVLPRLVDVPDDDCGFGHRTAVVDEHQVAAELRLAPVGEALVLDALHPDGHRASPHAEHLHALLCHCWRLGAHCCCGKIRKSIWKVNGLVSGHAWLPRSRHSFRI